MQKNFLVPRSNWPRYFWQEIWKLEEGKLTRKNARKMDNEIAGKKEYS